MAITEMVLVDSPTYHSSRDGQSQGNAQAPTSRPLVVYSPLFHLGMGRWLRTRETALSVLVSHTLIPVFGSIGCVKGKTLAHKFVGDFIGDSMGGVRKSGKKP